MPDDPTASERKYPKLVTFIHSDACGAARGHLPDEWLDRLAADVAIGLWERGTMMIPIAEYAKRAGITKRADPSIIEAFQAIHAWQEAIKSACRDLTASGFKVAPNRLANFLVGSKPFLDDEPLTPPDPFA